jgi:hypothetical protein
VVQEGFISLPQSDKSIIFCFTPLVIYESMRDPFGSLDDSSPLSLQFSSMSEENTKCLIGNQIFALCTPMFATYTTLVSVA